MGAGNSLLCQSQSQLIQLLGPREPGVIKALPSLSNPVWGFMVGAAPVLAGTGLPMADVLLSHTGLVPMGLGTGLCQAGCTMCPAQCWSCYMLSVWRNPTGARAAPVSGCGCPRVALDALRFSRGSSHWIQGILLGFLLGILVVLV